MTKPVKEFETLMTRVPGTVRDALKAEIQVLCTHFGVKALPAYTTVQGSHWAQKRSKNKAFIVECRGAGAELMTHDEVCTKFNMPAATFAMQLTKGKGSFNRRVGDDLFTITRK